MADDTPPTGTPESPDSPKNETVRITLPPKAPEASAVKRETVRIQPPGAVPKKDSSRLPGIGGVPPPAAPKPFMPPPSAPKPPGAPGLPARPAPPAGVLPPKPPGAPAVPGARPAIPGAPAAPGAPKAPAYAEAAPAAMKAAAPKKETARISVAPESKPMPKATIRMQQTQPLSSAPAPALRSAGGLASTAVVAEADPMVGVMSWIVLVVSLASAVLGYLAYSA